MTAVKKWVAAGSSAAVLAGGLFLGAPAAHADACAPAGAAQSGLIAAADDVHDTGVHFNSLVTDAGTLAELEAAQVALENAILEDDTKGVAQSSWQRIRQLQQGYAEKTEDAEVDAAWAASSAAAAAFEAEALNSGVTMEDGGWLVDLFVGSCGPLLTGTGSGAEDDSDDWSDSDDWAGSGADSGSGMNQGINMQTAEEGGLSTGVLAGLLAAGAAVSGAVAFRMRRGRA